jgi:hypothetical protein
MRVWDGTHRVVPGRAVSTLATGIVVLLAVAACAGGASDSSAGGTALGAEPGQGTIGDAAVDTAVDTAVAGDESRGDAGGLVGKVDPLQTGEAVIATASVDVRVDDVATTLPKLTALALSVDGFVASQDSSTDPSDPTRATAVVVLRVPTDRMPDVLDQVGSLGEVLGQRSEQRVVTEQVIDVNSRVASARASVARIQVLLDRAQSISDIVRIEGELSRREADLDALLAQQRGLRDRTEYATVSVTLLSPEAVVPTEDETGFVAGLRKGWGAFTDSLTWALTVVGAVLPFAALAAVLLVPVAVVWRRRAAAARAGRPAPSEPLASA